MRPLGDRVTVQRIKAESKTAWGFVLPDGDDRADSHEGIVLAVGEGERREGKLVPVDCEVGARVIYSTRIDSFDVKGEQIDVVEEGSIVGRRT